VARQPGYLNPDDTYPPLDFGPGTPAARQMVNDIIALKKEAVINRSFRDGANRGDAASRASTADQIQSLQAQTDLLNSYAVIEYAEFTNWITGFGGYYTGAVPTIKITTPTGRIRLGFGGAANGGDTRFLYSITGATSGVIVGRDSILTNFARIVAVSGGASYTPSGYLQTVLTVPANEELTIRLELWVNPPDAAYIAFAGGSISAQVAP